MDSTYNPNYNSLYNGNYNSYYSTYCPVTIQCRRIWLKSVDSTMTYNGVDTLRAPTVTVYQPSSTYRDWIEGKEGSFSNFAYLTNAGETNNSFDYSLADGEDPNDYCITTSYGPPRFSMATAYE